MFKRLYFGLCVAACVSVAVGQDVVPYPEYDDSSDGGYEAAYDENTGSFYTEEKSSYTSQFLWPTRAGYELLGPMDSRNGRGSLDVQHWAFMLNIGQYDSGNWHADFRAGMRMSWFNGSGAAELDVERLYTVRMQFNASYRFSDATRLLFGIDPQISTDFDTWTNKNIYFGGYAMIAGKVNDSLRGGIGIGYYPQLGSFPLLPVAQFTWHRDANHYLQLEGLRLAYNTKVSDGFTWGPFVGVSSGTWTVNRHRQTHQLRWVSGVAGVGLDIGLGKWGSAKPRLKTDLGFTFGNSGSIHTSNGRHELEKYHYDPGFYLRAGLEFNF